MDASDDLLDGEPPAINPYEVLGLERTATADQVKSAYRKLALKNHPDKVSEDQKQQAHETFQSIAFAYAILSDPTRRKRYDETGSTSESAVDSDGFNWSDFYREQFRDAISEDAIEKFAKQYRGSDEERDDILIAYEEHEGNMDAIYETVMLSDVLQDDERFRKIIDNAIASKDVPALKAYTKESKRSRQARIKAAKSEATEAEEHAKELGVHDKLFGNKKGKKKESSEDALAALIRRNQQGRESFLDNLAAKYTSAPTTGKRGKKRRLVYYPQYCFHLSPTINKWCPLRAVDIAGLVCRPGFEDAGVFFQLNYPIQWVRIIGVVVAIDDYHGHRVYTIDDSTGQCIECTLAIPTTKNDTILHRKAIESRATNQQIASAADTTKARTKDPTTTIPFPADADVGTVLDIKGTVKLFRGQKQIGIQKATQVWSTNDEVLFWNKARDFRRDVLGQPWVLKDKEVRMCRRLQQAEAIEPEVKKRRKIAKGLARGTVQHAARMASLKPKIGEGDKYDALGL
ncbi:hypothetical protein GGS24DRAFT_491694 [Hypoxylon argillaceum]|nr:hypothetical protein GGS24DRAFT_491694 [Hypoxylon argillaceum]